MRIIMYSLLIVLVGASMVLAEEDSIEFQVQEIPDETRETEVMLEGNVYTKDAVDKIEVYINNELLEGTRGSAGHGTLENQSNRIETALALSIPLQLGVNEIRLVVYTGVDEAEISYTVERIEATDTPGSTWLVTIGINDYLMVPRLRYVVFDAQDFHECIKQSWDIQEDHEFLLLNGEATRQNIENIFDSVLPEKVGYNDTVFIYFGGHGAVEPDRNSPDGDGLSKYLLPVGADPDHLADTAIPMVHIQSVFERIKADRVIFFADACYSGATGGRTLRYEGAKAALLKEDFLSRVAQSRGRVIISAAQANQVSQERDDLKHGVFTYYFLKGMDGAADKNLDGTVTLEEISNYLTENVEAHTNGTQSPEIVLAAGIQKEMVIGKSGRFQFRERFTYSPVLSGGIITPLGEYGTDYRSGPLVTGMFGVELPFMPRRLSLIAEIGFFTMKSYSKINRRNGTLTSVPFTVGAMYFYQSYFGLDAAIAASAGLGFTKFFLEGSEPLPTVDDFFAKPFFSVQLLLGYHLGHIVPIFDNFHILLNPKVLWSSYPGKMMTGFGINLSLLYTIY